MAKCDGYGFNRATVAYIYSFPKNRKQCVRINGTQSYFGNIISGVLQGSILSPILYSVLSNKFFYFILLATANSFGYVDSFALARFGKFISVIIGSLECECEIALSWFNENSKPAKTFYYTNFKIHKNVRP